MKTLKQLLELKKPEVPTPSAPVEPDSVTAYVPKTKDEKRFMDKHVIKKTPDVCKNGDNHFQAANIKAYDRSVSNHGYNKGEDQKVYESQQPKSLSLILREKRLTPAEMSKREEVAKAIERKNPGMEKGKKMAIATTVAKRVAEEHVDEANQDGLKESAAAHGQFLKYHDNAKKLLVNIQSALDTHTKNVKDAHWGNVGDIQSIHQDLQLIHNRVLQHGEYAQPVVVAKEEVELFNCFAEDFRASVQQVFESLNEKNQQKMIEMIEANEVDDVAEIVKEILNG